MSIPTVYGSSIGERIAALRRQHRGKRGKKLTQQELAEQIGVGRATLAAWEVGSHNPSDKNVEKLADFFRTTADFLWSGGDTVEAAGAGSVGEQGEMPDREQLRLFGRRIEQCRRRLELEEKRLISQRELADRIGVDVRAIQSWEGGQYMPSAPHLRRLLRELKASPGELLRGLPVIAEMLNDERSNPDETSAGRAEPVQYTGGRTSQKPRSRWTRTPVAFYHGELAPLDDWCGPDVSRSRAIRGLVSGLIRSGVKRSDLGGIGNLEDWVADGLRMVAEAKQEKS